MNTIVFGDVGNWWEDTEVLGCFQYPDFIFDEFKLVFHDGSNGNVETVVKIEKPTEEDFEYYGQKEKMLFGAIKLQGYKDEYEQAQDYMATCYIEGLEDFSYPSCWSCDGGNYNRAETIIYILNKIMYDIRNRSTEVKVLDKKQQKGENKGKIKSVKEYDDTVFLAKDICKYFYLEDSEGENTHKINCPCWSVRGHYRHYKSGKVIFVENYKKGKDRAKVEPKEKTYMI